MDKPVKPRYSLDLLRGFEAAARHLSFTRAAAELFVTQSAVSREIKTLEAQLDVRLFDRVNRGLRLTDAGLALFRPVSEALRLIERGVEEVTGSAGARLLTVTTNVPFASFWLVPRLPRFAALHPDINVRIAASNRVANLEREGVDIAIRHISLGAMPAGAIELMTEWLFPVCAPSLLRDSSRPLLQPQHLAHHILLQFEPEDMPQRWRDWSRWLGEMKLTALAPAGRLSFSHYDQVIQAALDGTGVALGRHLLVQRHLANGTLVAPFGTAHRVAVGGRYAITLAAGAAERPAVKAFIDWVREEAAADSLPGVAKKKSGRTMKKLPNSAARKS